MFHFSGFRRFITVLTTAFYNFKLLLCTLLAIRAVQSSTVNALISSLI